MIDLAASPAAPVAAVAAHQTANSPQRDAGTQPDETPFQAVLAQELAQVHPEQAARGKTATGGAGKARPGHKSDHDAAQTAAACAASASQACAAAIPLPPALTGMPTPPPPTPAGALAPLALAAPHTGSAALALGRHPNPDAGTSAQATASPGSPSVAPLAEFAAAGKFALPADGESRRKVAPDTSLSDQGKAAPAAIQSGSTAPAPLAQAPAAAIDAHVAAPGWDQGLGDKLVWMAGQRYQVAELHLNPPDLGPLKITLTLNHDQASAQFVSAHAQVRDAIETAMPRLREMLAGSGITLGNANVSTGAFGGQPQPQHAPRAYQVPPAAATAQSGGITHGERLLQRALGLVDTFV